MSNYADVAFVQQFSSNILMLAQQKNSKLFQAVVSKQVKGKYSLEDRLGTTDLALATSKHADTVYGNIEHSRRRLILNTYQKAEIIDKADEIRMLIDPKSAYAMALAAGAGRKIDRVICEAATGNAVAVDSSDAGSNVAVALTVDEDFTTTNSDLIYEKVVEAKRLMLAQDVDPDEEFFFVADATALHNLLKGTQVSSADYNVIRTLVQGKVDTFMGFKFIMCNRITTSSEGFAQNLAFTKNAIRLGIGLEPTVKIAELPNKNHATHAFLQMDIGAVRMDESALVVVESYR